MASLRRLRRRLASEGGSLLVEVLVSASILLTVGAGVVMVLMTSDAQSSLQRSKALATDVAQTKLDALRAIGYNDLRPLNETSTVTEGGIAFTVVSTAAPVSQTDAPTGCLTSRARDYMTLKATVTWAKMGARKPVVLQTMVAAPIGAGGGLVVSVTGALGQPMPNIPVLLSSGGGSATSDATGCARWDAVAAGSGYSLSASVPGYVQPNGQQDVNITGLNIEAEETAQKSFAYDRGGSVRLQFQQKTTGASAWTNVDPDALPADVVLAASDSITKPVAPVSGAVGSAGLFYPYPSTAYSVYADNCTAAKPAAGSPSTTTLITAGGTAPSATGSLNLQLPNLNVRVLNGNTATTKIWVKTACGTIIGPRAIVADGTLKNPGLPYGTGFTVCAVDGLKKVSRTVDNTSYAAPSATTTNILTVPLVNGGSCPFATT
jgi:hypothetical protein